MESEIIRNLYQQNPISKPIQYQIKLLEKIYTNYRNTQEKRYPTKNPSENLNIYQTHTLRYDTQIILLIYIGSCHLS